MSERRKPVRFRGTSRADLRAFPLAARRQAGHQLDLVQRGLDPDDWKPMTIIGAGVREIRIREESGAFRVIYIAKFDPAVFVLHCFRKTSQKTSRPDLELVKRRYGELVRELGHER